MKNALPIFFFAMLISGSKLAAQTGTVPSSGMETWTNVFFVYDEPNGWSTSNQYKALDANNPTTVYKSSDKYSGSWAAKIETKAFPTSVDPAYDTLGLMLSGTIDLNTGDYKGFPYAFRPEKLSYYMKYAPASGDTGGVLTTLTKWDTATGTRITVAEGGRQFTQAEPAYTLYEDVLVYYTNDTPDTALIVFVSSDFLAARPRVGSVLFVDDITYQGTVSNTVGISDKPARAARVFPNPAVNEIFFETAEDAVRIVAVSCLGRELAVIPVTNGKARLETSALRAGLYFYRVYTSAGAKPYTGKFTIVK